MILVFAAMLPEVRACLGGADLPAPDAVGGFPVYRSGDVAVCQTGLGRRAIDAASAALAHFEPRAVLSAGVAGGLAPSIAAGDLVLCRQIDHESHRTLSVDASVLSDKELMDTAFGLASGLGMSPIAGTSITVDEAAWTPAEKAAHHAWKSHDIVEMESYWTGEAAVRANVPFLAVRTVSDAADHELQQTGAMRDDGTFDQQALINFLQKNPEAGPAIAATSERSRLAMQNLERFLTALMPFLAATGVT